MASLINLEIKTKANSQEIEKSQFLLLIKFWKKDYLIGILMAGNWEKKEPYKYVCK